MAYTIKFFRMARELGATPWAGSFDSAKQHALDHMPIKQADRVEIRDDADKLVFHHPRTLHASQP